MQLRSKLLALGGAAVVVTLALSAYGAYVFARTQLESTAKTQLEEATYAASAHTEAWFARLEGDVARWAETPLIRRVLQSPDDKALVNTTHRYLLRVAEEKEVIRSVALFDCAAREVASSAPHPVGLRSARDDVSRDADFQAARNGNATVSQVHHGAVAGTATVSVATPVWVGGRVRGVLRLTVDLRLYIERLVKPLRAEHDGRLFVLQTALDGELPSRSGTYDIVADREYTGLGPHGLPDVQQLSGMAKRDEGFVRLRARDGVGLAAFRRTREPGWLFVSERPLEEVLAPIAAMRYKALAAAGAVLLLIWALGYWVANPLVGNVRQCPVLAWELRAQRLARRAALRSQDKTGVLSQGVAATIASLEEHHKALDAVERKYQSLFENVVVPMVETTPQGIILTANSALALALGFDSPAQLIGRQITRFYADDTRRAEFLAALAEKGFVEGFETKYVRRDGAVGLASVSARAERDPEGNMVLIQSIPHDITERRMAEQEREHAREAEKLLARSQLETLRYQVNPHFLFNTLNSIDALSHEAPDRIPALLGELTDYLRFSLQPRQGDLAPLRRELEAIGAYLAIEKVRFAENLQVTIEASEEAQAQLVPELVLQPLVENAIEHGMPTSPLPLRLVVRIRRDRGRLRIVVSNTGRWSGPETERYGRGHVGLSNLRSRLELLYPGSYRLEVKERKGWVTVSVELPGEEANSEWRIDDGRCHCTDC